MARVQFIFNDFRTKSPIINDVESWKIVEFDVNRGTYRDTWPMLPFKMGSPTTEDITTVSGQTMPDDGAHVFNGAGALDTDWPEDASKWDGTAIGKIRVPDEIMHVSPRTRDEVVKYLEFYSGPFVNQLSADLLLTSVTGDETTDIVTKASHGLTTGDLVKYISGTGFAGYTANDLFYVAKLSVDTFYLCSTLADAYALTPANFTTAGSNGVFVKLSETRIPTGDWRMNVLLSDISTWYLL